MISISSNPNSKQNKRRKNLKMEKKMERGKVTPKTSM